MTLDHETRTAIAVNLVDASIPPSLIRIDKVGWRLRDGPAAEIVTDQAPTFDMLALEALEAPRSAVADVVLVGPTTVRTGPSAKSSVSSK